MRERKKRSTDDFGSGSRDALVVQSLEIVARMFFCLLCGRKTIALFFFFLNVCQRRNKSDVESHKLNGGGYVSTPHSTPSINPLSPSTTTPPYAAVCLSWRFSF